MWLMTPRGFYSVTELTEDTLNVRARVRGDLDNLADLLPNSEPFCLAYTDYPWRIEVDKKDWAFAMAKMAMEIDYRNFKDEVARVQGKKRSYIYASVWWELLELEDLDPDKRKREYGWLADLHADLNGGTGFRRATGFVREPDYDTGGAFRSNLVDGDEDFDADDDEGGPGFHILAVYDDDDNVREEKRGKKRNKKQKRNKPMARRLTRGNGRAPF